MSLEARSSRYIKKVAMALDQRDLSKITKSHSKLGPKYVDHSKHVSDSKVPGEYLDMLASPETFKARKRNISGIRKKMVHDLPTEGGESTIMTKAYHTNPESATRKWVKYPISGWATMTTKALFDAAGLSENAEEVYAHEMEGTPVTVHKFGKGYETIDEARRSGLNTRSIDYMTVYKIGALDFLTGNVDRHDLNLMIAERSNTDKRGYNPILAIDHERNFQYVKPAKYVLKDWHWVGNTEQSSTDRPADYVQYSALKSLARPDAIDQESFVDWWKDVSKKLEAAFTENLEYIKDKSLREHVRRNFMQRVMVINKWTEPVADGNYQEMSLFDPMLPTVARIIPKPRAPAESINKILDALPKDNPMKAVELLITASEGRKSYSSTEKIKDCFSRLINTLPPADVVKVYDKYKAVSSGMIAGQSVPFTILYNIFADKNMNAANALLDYNNDSGKILFFWKERLEEITGRKKDEATLPQSSEQQQA